MISFITNYKEKYNDDIKSCVDDLIDNVIDNLYDYSMANGALGGKLLGAGGGGFMLLYIPQNLQKNFFKKTNNIINVPFRFYKEG